MYLMFLIVQNEDADILTRRLNNAGVRVTRLNTVGGFLSPRQRNLPRRGAGGRGRAGDGSRPQDLPHPQALHQPAVPSAAEPAHLAMAAPAYPLEVIVGGATVFMIPVSAVRTPWPWRTVCRSMRSPAGRRAGSAGGSTYAHGRQHRSADDAEPVTRALDRRRVPRDAYEHGGRLFPPGQCDAAGRRRSRPRWTTCSALSMRMCASAPRQTPSSRACRCLAPPSLSSRRLASSGSSRFLTRQLRRPADRAGPALPTAAGCFVPLAIRHAKLQQGHWA